MDYRYLDAFREAARLGSFSKAADELRIAPSALTRQIQLFEESVGQECFIRAGRAVRLTTYGASLYGQIALFEKQITEIDQTSNLLRIGCLQSVFESSLASIVAKLPHKIASEIHIDIGSPNHIQDLILQGKVDVSLSTLSLNSEGFKSEKIFSEKLMLVSQNKDWLSSPVEANWIIYTPLEKAWSRVTSKQRLKSFQTIRTNSLNAAIDLASLGAGITIIPDGPNLRRRGFHKKELLRHAADDIYFSYPAYRTLPPHIAELQKLLLLIGSRSKV